ncbi:C40 family peptidase [Nocardia sp. NPDC052566]|uniref:C40 family peptidase n=1 Tax=Nocardia sp. NPDC052566 TaxID=3364330 RepID=UPI0037C75699
MLDLSALATPLFDLLASFGPGVLPTDGPADQLRRTSTTVDQVHQLGRDSINAMNTAWDGVAADAATAKALRVQTSAATISDRGNDMATVVGQAAAEVETGKKDLTGIAQSFVDTVAKTGPALATPEGLAFIVGSAIDHLNQALGVVGRVQNELGTHTAAMSELTPPPPTAPALAGVGTQATQGVQQVLSAVTGLAGSAGQTLSGLLKSSSTAGTPNTQGSSPGTQQAPSTPGKPTGTGVKIQLPDGSIVEAPNEKAATAVRAALGAVGTPYVWGGNTPGVGLDCSGLTQCAYGEAGVDLPRLANQQSVGQPVSPGDLMPGDLAIWDGHVAMVIGNGQFVEAGNPVQISAIRTENIGMDFYGFYRPTA